MNPNASTSVFHTFRQRLHRGGKYSYYWTPDTGEYYTSKKTGEQSEAKRTLWFPADQTPPIPTSWGGNVFYPVHPSIQRRATWQRSVIGGIAAINCVFAEVDGKDMVQPTDADIAAVLVVIERQDNDRVAAAHAAGQNARPNPPKTLRRQAILLAKETIFKGDIGHYNELARHHVMTMTPQPSAIIFSGGGWHLYWLLSETFHIQNDDDRQRAKKLQKHWVEYIGGDDGAKDLARVLRPVGTQNRKAKYAPNFPTVEFVKLDYGTEYAISELESYLPTVERPQRAQPRATTRTVTTSTTTDDNATTTATTPQAAGRQRTPIIAAYNAKHPITTILSRYGYTRHGERYMRPGGTDAPSVVVNADNTITTFSSNDPLFNDNCHPVDPFNAMRVWEHDGDFLAALDAAALDAGMFTTRQARAIVDNMKDYILTNDIGQHMPDEKRTRHKSGRIVYRTRSTDVRIISRILDIMHMAGRVADVTVNAYQVVRGTDSHGQHVETHSHKTVAAVVQRHDWLFSAEDADAPNTWHLSLRVDVSTFPLNIKELLIDLGGKVETSTFDHWKNDDVYGSGTSGAVRSALRAEALAERKPGESDGAVTDRYRTKLAELAPGLQAMAIPVIEAIMTAGGSGITTPELAEAFSLTTSSVNGTLRKLRKMGLVESHRQYKAPSIHFATGDLFAEIDEQRHEFRTYNAGVNRLAKSLEKAAARTENQIGFTRAGGGDTAALEKRQRNIVRQWREALGALHPDWGKREIHEWIWAEKPTATPYLDRREIERAAEERAAEWDSTRQAMMQTAADLRSQGITGAAAMTAAIFAGYEPAEARMVASWV